MDSEDADACNVLRKTGAAVGKGKRKPKEAILADEDLEIIEVLSTAGCIDAIVFCTPIWAGKHPSSWT